MRRALKARERLSFPFRANPVFLESVGFSFELCQLRQVDFPLVFIVKDGWFRVQAFRAFAFI